MPKFLMPKGMRVSTLEERKNFYVTEVEFSKVVRWLKFRKERTNYSVMIGRHTKIFPELEILKLLI